VGVIQRARHCDIAESNADRRDAAALAPPAGWVMVVSTPPDVAVALSWPLVAAAYGPGGLPKVTGLLLPGG
jgi:hypothetical protein